MAKQKGGITTADAESLGTEEQLEATVDGGEAVDTVEAPVEVPSVPETTGVANGADALADAPAPQVEVTADMLEVAKAKHAEWLDKAYADGWTYAPVENKDKKQSPLVRHFLGLTHEQKVAAYFK